MKISKWKFSKMYIVTWIWLSLMTFPGAVGSSLHRAGTFQELIAVSANFNVPQTAEISERWLSVSQVMLENVSGNNGIPRFEHLLLFAGQPILELRQNFRIHFRFLTILRLDGGSRSLSIFRVIQLVGRFTVLWHRYRLCSQKCIFPFRCKNMHSKLQTARHPIEDRLTVIVS